MYPALRLLSPTDQSTENGKRRNLIYTELPSQHGNGSELHPVIARERPTCLCDGKDDIGKVSKNARGSVPFHVKHSIKLPVSLSALRLGRRHASPSVQENGTGGTKRRGAMAWDAQRWMIGNAPPASIPTAKTTRIDGKRTRKREGSPQERHRRHPKGDAETPSEGENGGETTRPAARRAGRGTRRSDTGHGTQAESTGAGGNRRAGGERNRLGRSDYRGKTGGSREGGERRCRFER